MPHDKFGQLLTEGDEVILRCKIINVSPGVETACNVTAEPIERPAGELYIPQIAGNSKLYEKLVKPTVDVESRTLNSTTQPPALRIVARVLADIPKDNDENVFGDFTSLIRIHVRSQEGAQGAVLNILHGNKGIDHLKPISEEEANKYLLNYGSSKMQTLTDSLKS